MTNYREGVELSESLYSMYLLKAKESPLGTTSTHGGVKVKKTAQGWEPIGEEKTKTAEDPENVRGSAQGYGTHNIQTGDSVTFKTSEGETFTGRVSDTSSKAATVITKEGRQFSAPWGSVTDFKGKGGVDTPVDPGGDLGNVPIPPDEFVANEWAAKFDDPNLTVDAIFDEVEKVNPGIRKAVEDAESRLEGIEQTIKRHRESGEGVTAVYSEARAAKHEKIMDKYFTPETIKNAKPDAGQKPVLVMLGGRGGSGKSWFHGQVYDPDKAIVLDADEIKGMLDEYEGWNAFQVHEESSDILEMIKARAQELGLNVVIDATLKTPDNAVANAEAFTSAGYDLEVHYMHAPRKIAAQRAMSRFTGKSGRYVPVGVILSNTENEKSFELIKKNATSWSFRDSSGGPPPKLVSEQGKGRFAKAMAELFGLFPLWKSDDSGTSSNAAREAREQYAYDFYDFRMPVSKDKYSDQLKALIKSDAEKGEGDTDKDVKKSKTEAFDLDKARGGTKYIRKFWKNGRWHYIYHDSKSTQRPRVVPDHKVLKNLGGSTGGALLIELPNGERKVMKYSTGSKHMKDEYTSNRVYEILGVPVPSVELHEGPKGLAQIADFVKGTLMGDLSRSEREDAVESLKQGFVADALLGNWDVLGMEEDNIIWDGSKAWRIDNGGGLRYRAQGQPKGDKFSTNVSELDSMRDPDRGAGKRAYSTVTEAEMHAQIRTVLAKKQTILAAIDDPALRSTLEARINSLERRVDAQKSIKGLESGPTLLKSYGGEWFLYEYGFATRFHWFHNLGEFTKSKTYYSSDEIKARGMRWVTIRGARVLLQGTSDGGYVVVGGAGGKLNHLKVDKVLSKDDYAAKRKGVEKKRKEELRSLTREEISEQAAKRKAEVQAKKTARSQYAEKVTSILGVSSDDLKSQISAKEMDDITDKARNMVENLRKKKTIENVEAEVEKVADDLAKKEAAKKVKDIERAALETLMDDYAPGDPNMKPELKKLLDADKAMEILSARKEFRKLMKDIAKGQVDVPSSLKVGDIYAGNSSSLPGEIEEEIRQQIETQKNMQLYDRLNAQSLSIQKHVDQGSISALNGLIGDIYGAGATFSTDTVENLGLEAIVRSIAIKVQQDGKGDIVRRALEEYSASERQKVVDKGIKEFDKRMENADNLRALAKDTDDAEAVLSAASANGHSLKQITAAQRALGTAVGSLRAVAHMLNALDDPPADVVQVDVGKDLARARMKAKKAGLERGDYSIKTVKDGRSKRLVLEISKDKVGTFMSHSETMRKDESNVAKIKRHEMNTGYTPPGSLDNFKLSAAQEAGLHFFRENKKVLLDFEAGLGKTAVAYAAIAEARNNMGAKKILVVTPAKLRGQFASDGKKYMDKETLEGLVASTDTTSKRERHERYTRESGIHVISQDLLREDAALVKAAGYDMVVVDEVHEMTAGTGKAGRFKALMDLADIPMKVAMSGTNIKNKKEELYRKINFIDPDHTLGSMAQFKKRYDGLNQGTGMFSDAANDAFRKEMAPYMYTQKNVLPVENVEQVERVPLTPQQRKEYAASERQYRADRDRGDKGASAKRDSRNYAIVTNGDHQKNAKLDRMVDILNEKHPGEKAVIHLSSPGKPILHAIKTATARLESEYGPGTVGVIKGGDSTAQLRKLKARFNDPDDPLRFIIGSKSLESGHNLQHGGTVTFHLDMPDSYAVKQQREARVFRRGQDKNTSTYTLSGLNPLDMRAEDIVETKRKEMGILGNPRSVSSMDDTGFIGMLNKYEMEAMGVKDE